MQVRGSGVPGYSQRFHLVKVGQYNARDMNDIYEKKHYLCMVCRTVQEADLARPQPQ